MSIIFRAVSVHNLRSGMKIARDVYTSEDASLPFIKTDTILTADIIDELVFHDISLVYIYAPDGDESPVLSDLPRVKRRKPIISQELRETALKGLSDVFFAISIGKSDIHESAKTVINHLDNIVESLVNAILSDENIIININDLKSFDEYTFHHSLSVAVLSIAIAQKLGFSRARIREVGMCAMVHDIGKIAVPIKIINKSSKLDSVEFSVIKTHSRAGFDFLSKSGMTNDNILLGVLHHHEKFDGTGYPDGLKGDAIPICSRIIAIADVYDALTSSRPYRTPMQPSDAMEYIMGGANTSFDFDLVNAFLHKIELYPVGTFVELSNGMVGIVLDNEVQLRPLVQTTSGELFDLARDKRFLNIVVDRALPDDHFDPPETSPPDIQYDA